MLAYHAIFGAYGFWLPNDPRGSYSTWVGAWDLYRYAGTGTKVDTRRSVAAREHDPLTRRRTKDALTHPPVIFNGHQALAIARGFAVACSTYAHRVLACAILPDHVHMVIETGADPGRTIGQFKRKASDALFNANLHPFAAETPCWAKRGWTVYLDTEPDVQRAIDYVERNPEKEGKRRQRWGFVIPC